MPMSLNRAELIGRLGRAAELRFTAEGQAVATFSLATDRPAKAGTRSEADWHRVVCWGKLGEFAGSHLIKGRLVYVSGRLAYRSWEDKDGQRHRATEPEAAQVEEVLQQLHHRRPMHHRPRCGVARHRSDSAQVTPTIPQELGSAIERHLLAAADPARLLVDRQRRRDVL